ncbi:MAG TPA: glycosyltransferase family 4 protein [Lachnospiraceae bacterium]|nr:glycosyltransferase family 4 protein [Lachnospiraceae bacterium]
MKILYIVYAATGHHIPYINALLDPDNENIFIVPGQIEGLPGKQYVLPYVLNRGKRDIVSHLKWLKKVSLIARNERADVVHFTYGDMLYKSFGLRLNRMNGSCIVVSFHRMDKSFLKRISRDLIMRKADFTTYHVADAYKMVPVSLRDKSCFTAYPSVLENIVISKSDARKMLGIDTGVPVISVTGIMDEYKGLDVLFDALEQVRSGYYLIIAGKPLFYSAEYIEERLKGLKCGSTKLLRFLSDKEFVACISASDIVAVPYLKSFEGTSGPMTEGIRMGKTIVGCSHGNIGCYIERYKIGYACEGGDPDSLAAALEKAIKKPVEYAGKMNDLVKMQTVGAFKDRFRDIYAEVYKRKRR